MNYHHSHLTFGITCAELVLDIVLHFADIEKISISVLSHWILIPQLGSDPSDKDNVTVPFPPARIMSHRL